MTTRSGRRFVLDYDGNGGFGPVSVWDGGCLTAVVTRHRLGDLAAPTSEGGPCPVCADPHAAQPYYPAVRWTCAEPECDQPPCGRGWRCSFYGMVTENPQTEHLTVRISRQDWWYHWRDVATLTVQATTQWRDLFDTWCRQHCRAERGCRRNRLHHAVLRHAVHSER